MLSSPAASGGALVGNHSRQQEILAAQVRLLYANVVVGISVTVLAATIVAFLQWGSVPNQVVIGWWLYLILVSSLRYFLTRRFQQAAPEPAAIARWRVAFAAGSGMAGFGWGAAGILLYPQGNLMNQVFLIFVLGGMMLGAASLLAARPEAFLAFLIPTGLAPAIYLLLQGDQTHISMAFLAAVFTIATAITTWRISITIRSSLFLQFENRDLVVDLQAAKGQAEALNQALEVRVQERTAELRTAAEQLRAEIAQREEMEEELLRVRKLESLGVLAGGIAHDFNNFITVVQGNVELAKGRLNPEDPTHEVLDQVAGACQRATFLASQLLTFAKGGAPVRRVVPISNLVRDAVHLIRAGSAVSTSMYIAEDLRFARVDPAQIGQALHNILLNAREAMPSGGIIEVCATNFAAPEGNGADLRIRISIRDYGPGIPSDILPRIFDPYFTTKPGGNGLGLATAHAIITKHDGHILVDSKPGEGTVFTIDLPGTDQAPLAETPVITGVQEGTERILVMDDEESLLKLLRTILTRLGYDVEVARDGAEAIAMYEAGKAEGKRFDAVLLDLTVSGGMGGVEAAAKLKELDPDAKLIVSSGYSDAPVMSNYAAYGFDAVIPKPWTAADVSDVLRKALVSHPDRKLG
jgi:signal transduction histidine kinase/ActR/RegA family two-component response regulator